MSSVNQPNEIRLIRIFDAPVHLVWAAWTEADHVAQWWGPRGFTITTHSKDLRVGGHWHYTMHGPDGVDYPNKTLYHQVETHKKLVYDHGGDDDRPPLFRVTVLFDEIDGKTHMDMTMAVATAQEAANIRTIIKSAGGNSTWDRLAEYLEKTQTGKERFVIVRSFAAPVHVLFEMWVDPQHLSQWLAPTGFSMDYKRADVKEGHTSFYAMTGDSGIKMYGRITYLKIRKPDYLIYEQQFCDENERISRHPMAVVWPETMVTYVAFAAEGPDQTRITITWEPKQPVTPDEIDVFVKAKPGMTQGWTGSFDKLEDYVNRNRNLPAA
jgi:uncharacterized protein YndB with AHSA1/START domain